MQILLETTISNANVKNLWCKQNNNKTPSSIFEWIDPGMKTFTSSRFCWEKRQYIFLVLTLSSFKISQGHLIFIAHLFSHPFNLSIPESLLRARRYTLPEDTVYGLSQSSPLLLQSSRALGTRQEKNPRQVLTRLQTCFWIEAGEDLVISRTGRASWDNLLVRRQRTLDWRGFGKIVMPRNFIWTETILFLSHSSVHLILWLTSTTPPLPVLSSCCPQVPNKSPLSFHPVQLLLFFTVRLWAQPQALRVSQWILS